MSDGTGRGPFIVFEGPEGAGKSYQIRRLAAALDGAGVAHRATREPGGTALSEAIREIILDRPDLHLDGVSELLLFSAARHAHVVEVIRPALERGEVVLCDRFELSTRVYQGFGRRVDAGTIAAITAAATGGIEPDLYLVLDVAPRVGRDRQHGPDFFPDRIESEAEGFMERVRAGYASLAASDPRIELVDASAEPSEVERAIRQVVERRFPALFWGSPARRDPAGER